MNPITRTNRLGIVAAFVAAFGLATFSPARAEEQGDGQADPGTRPAHIVPKTDGAIQPLATSAHLNYYGGRVISNVQVVAVNWGSGVDSTVSSGIGGFYSAVTNSAYFDWLTEYNTVGKTGFGDGLAGSNQTIGRGTFLSMVTITPSTSSTNITDAQIQSEIIAKINSGVLPAPTTDAGGNVNTIYMINFPGTITTHDPSGGSSCVQFCAYHGTLTRNGQNIPYGVLPDLGGACASGCGASTKFNNTTSVASHELIEAVTDMEVGIGTTVARPLAWYDPAAGNGEIGDICNAQQATVAGYTVQKEWSNSSNACIATKTVTNDFSMSMTPASASVAQGSSVSYTVSTSVVSGAAESLSLSVSGLPAGVTGSFSPSTVTAGGSSTLTLTASASATTGSKSFTVTATGASASHTASSSVNVTTTGGGDIALTSGVAKAGSVSGATANAGWTYYTIVVPSGATNLAISLNGLSADADLYDQQPASAGGTAAHPTTSVYTGRSWNGSTTAESLAHANPIAGTWSIGVTNYATGTINYTITATVTTATATFTISGNAGTTGATVTAGSANATSDASSNFTLSNLAAGTYTVTPSKSGCTFTPANRSVTVGPSATGVNFTASCGGGTTQLLANPGFESGAVSWTASTGVIDNSTSEAAHAGSWKAWMDGYGSAHTDSLLQQVSIASTATTATLSFWLHVDTAETTTTTQYDKLNVQIRNSSGAVLATLATYSNLNAAAGYTQKSFNLIAYKGQTIQVYLVGTEDGSAQTSFVVDDFALNVQ